MRIELDSIEDVQAFFNLKQGDGTMATKQELRDAIEDLKLTVLAEAQEVKDGLQRLEDHVEEVKASEADLDLDDLIAEIAEVKDAVARIFTTAHEHEAPPASEVPSEAGAPQEQAPAHGAEQEMFPDDEAPPNEEPEQNVGVVKPTGDENVEGEGQK